MSEGPIEQHIDAVDAYARTLSLRTRQNSSLTDLTDAVRQLHIALRHLRIEAADADSLLADPESIYARQLRPLVDSCLNTLSALEDALDDSDDGHGDAGLRSVRRRLRGDKASLDGFLDTVQLQKSKAVAATQQVVVADLESLDHIKDKVDSVAKRVFSRRDSGFTDDDDEDRLWREFKTELEKEGFSPSVLKQHKDVLRAYIRSLETVASQSGGRDLPSVRGMLEYEAESNRTTRQPSNKEAVHYDPDNTKFSPTLSQRRAPEPPPVPPKEPLPELESPPTLQPTRPEIPDDGSDDGSVASSALILTRDIMDMDRIDADMANMHLHPNSQQQHMLPSSPEPKYLSWHAPSSFTSQDGTLPMPPNARDLGTSPNAGFASFTPMDGHMPPKQAWTGLAPDRFGHEIPMNAPWTRISRDLVSPEVLARAGVRYEARPTYVAVLGRLTRTQIADYARQSADARAARVIRHNSPRRGEDEKHDQRSTRPRTDSKSSHDDDDDESDLFDESDSTDSDDDGTESRNYPFIVSPPDKTSPAATVKPKSILKNRNENHVRFDPEPYEVSASKSPNSRDDRRAPPSSRSSRRRDDDDDDRRRERDRRHEYRSGEGSDRQHRSRHYDDRDYHRERRHRGDREREREKERRRDKKKAWGETLGAVGLGGAAVSLLTVLAEAAS